MNNKTILGIPVNFYAALIYVCAITSTTAFIGIVIFTLFVEKNEAIQKTVKTALFVFLIVEFVSGTLSGINYLVRIISTNLTVYNQVYSKLDNLVDFAAICTYIVLGIIAFFSLQGSSSTASAAASENKAAKICPNCGSALNEGSAFCIKCGTKIG